MMNKKTLFTIIGLLLVVSVAIYFFVPFESFSIIGTGEVFLEDGTVFWLNTLNVDSGQEKLIHFYDATKLKEYNDGKGNIVQPKDSFTLTVASHENNCRYVANPEDHKWQGYAFAYSPTVRVFFLGNPERDITYKISTDKTGEEILDAFNPQTIVLTDEDGKGELRIKAQNTLQGKTDCPSPDGVIVVAWGGQYYFKDKSLYDSARQWWKDSATFASLNTFEKILIRGEDDDVLGVKNSVFQTAFNNPTFEGSNEFIGQMPLLSLGTPVITVTADQDMFDSVVFSPAVHVDFEITEVSTSEFASGEASTIKVGIKNLGDVDGVVNVVPTAKLVAFQPSSKSALVSNYQEFFFIGQSETIGKNNLDDLLTIRACTSGSQFSGSLCKEVIKSIVIRGEGFVVNCGNGICESHLGESSSTCIKDCPKVIDCKLIKNSFLNLNTNTCECLDGFEMTNDGGQLKCVEKTPFIFSWGKFLITLLFTLVIMGIFIWKTQGALPPFKSIKVLYWIGMVLMTIVVFLLFGWIINLLAGWFAAIATIGKVAGAVS